MYKHHVTDVTSFTNAFTNEKVDFVLNVFAHL